MCRVLRNWVEKGSRKVMAKLCDPGLFRAKTSLWCLPLLPEEGRLVRRVAVEAKAEQRPLGPKACL